MLRQILISTGLAVVAQAAVAAEAGKVIFVAGTVQAAGHGLALGAAVQEGELLSTGADGYVYIKTLDDGLFILRPNTRARIAAYHVDRANPANTRVKLELLSGVARSRSGEAVKEARQNFRFNTPVAAIGVRGTDFSVSTDQDTTRVTVFSGGVTVSGFGGACHPEGVGPCEGTASRELSAAQRGQLLQFQRGQAAPQLLPAGALAPDAVAPPRTDEPIGKNGGSGAPATLGPSEPNLDPQKTVTLQEKAPSAAPTTPGTPSTPGKPDGVPPLVEQHPDPSVPVVPTPTPDPTPAPVVDPATLRQVSWGRYTSILTVGPLDLSKVSGKVDILAINPIFAIVRNRDGNLWQTPERGSASFTLQSSEAYLVDDATQLKMPATLENGALNVDFGKSSFTTSFDLLSPGERFKMQAQGTFGRDGQMYGQGQFVRPGNNMDVSGALIPNGAVYLFEGRIDNRRDAIGGTSWGK